MWASIIKLVRFDFYNGPNKKLLKLIWGNYEIEDVFMNNGKCVLGTPQRKKLTLFGLNFFMRCYIRLIKIIISSFAI